MQIAFLAVLALLSQPNQREKTQISFSKKQLNGYLPTSTTEFLATIESKIPKTTPLNKNTHRIKKKKNKHRARKKLKCFSLFVDLFRSTTKLESLRFFWREFFTVDEIWRVCKQRMRTKRKEESMNPCMCLLTWPIGARANVPGGGNNSIIKLHVACTTVLFFLLSDFWLVF